MGAHWRHLANTVERSIRAAMRLCVKLLVRLLRLKIPVNLVGQVNVVQKWIAYT